MITIRIASMAAGAAEPLMLLRLLGGINLAPVASRARSARWDCVLIFIRHHIQAVPNIKSDCKENIRVVREMGRDEDRRSESVTRKRRFEPVANGRPTIR